MGKVHIPEVLPPLENGEALVVHRDLKQAAREYERSRQQRARDQIRLATLALRELVKVFSPAKPKRGRKKKR